MRIGFQIVQLCLSKIRGDHIYCEIIAFSQHLYYSQRCPPNLHEY